MCFGGEAGAEAADHCTCLFLFGDNILPAFPQNVNFVTTLVGHSHLDLGWAGGPQGCFSHRDPPTGPISTQPLPLHATHTQLTCLLMGTAQRLKVVTVSEGLGMLSWEKWGQRTELLNVKVTEMRTQSGSRKTLPGLEGSQQVADYGLYIYLIPELGPR